MIKVEGMGEVRKAFLKVTAEGHRVSSREIIRAGLNIQRGAKERSPVDTGRLRNSIAVAENPEDIPVTVGTELAKNQIRAGMLSAVVGTNVEYAPLVEFGTSRMPARSFLFSAHEEERPKLLQRLKEQLGAAFVKIGQ